MEVSLVAMILIPCVITFFGCMFLLTICAVIYKKRVKRMESGEDEGAEERD